MNPRTFKRILLAVVAALVVSGIGFGFAQSWGSDEGIRTLWVAAGICLGAAAFGLLFAGVLEVVDQREPGEPSAPRWGLGATLALTLLAGLLVFALRVLPPAQLATWLVIHYLVQLAVQLFVFTRPERAVRPS